MKNSEFMWSGLWIPLFISVLIAALAALDLALDFALGATLNHLLIMAALTAVATIGAVFFANRLHAAWQHERERRLRLQATRTRTVEWQQEERELLLRVNQAIKRQFEKWDLSSSETEVALHLLKGLSMKEIADLRGSTLGTIKQQSHVLYQKAGLKGRAELSAFFLGSLLPEDLAGVDSPPSSQP